jgi:hypothetical protein
MIISFELPGLPKSMNGAHGHWRSAAAERKKWRELSCGHAIAAKQAAKLGGMKPWKQVKLTCTRSSSSQMDFDNLVASFKGCVDGLKDAGIIADDKDAVIIMRDYRCEWAPRGKGKIRIKVESLA